MCLTSAQLQQKAVERHRLRARLVKLCQRRVLLVELGRSRKGLKRWWHQGEALGQVLQVCELVMSATDEALSDLRGVGLLTGKRKRGKELTHQPVGYSLWEPGSLGGHNELLFGCLDGEVEALHQREAV